MARHRLLIVSDIHYAGEAERARRGYEARSVGNPLVRIAIQTFRYWVWLRDPLGQNYLFEKFLNEANSPDYVVANGDYSCDSAVVGVSDDASFASANECLGKLRSRFGGKLRITFG